ncbi:radical SAM protein [Labilibaculum antarcticum]|uniref:Radical SAM protein n=1 Tax=Labilibaculum antarcticum TaxID=1717717 RepID=A0A1Y1CM14_9BACT|nr:radical SAM protein [Labilibaculum antarcticum]BAX81330.1 radical SAM protein [Labilibaculum antarcticum]
MYKYLFGPVPSRRLGVSLGVDLVPKKVCSIDCVYCEVGKTTKLSVTREDYISSDKIKTELEHYFKNNPQPDYITITASGEPTLNSNLGEIIRFVKQTKPEVSVALITNGTLLHDSKVREAIKDVDLVLPSLDAGTEEAFRRINRPHKDLDFKQYIQGLIDFGKEFTGKIWLEVFILPGYNDSEKELSELKKLILKIRHDSVQLNTLDRPGTIANLRGATQDELQQVIDFWKLDHVEIIAKAKQGNNEQGSRKDTENAILETVSRRPCTLEDLTTILGMCDYEVSKCLDALVEKNLIETIEQERGVFYQSKEGE